MDISLKVVIVGTMKTGKKEILAALSSSKRSAVAKASSEVTITVQGKPVKLNVICRPEDDAAINDIEEFYLGTDIVIICFAIDNPSSFHAVEEKWKVELRKFCSNSIWILVGTKADYRGRVHSEKLISTDQGLMMSVKVDCNEYYEIATSNAESVMEMFKRSASAALELFAQAATKYLTEKESSNHERPRWQPDEGVNKCNLCHADFSTFRRRHHCRNCGLIFCDNCSKNEIPIPLLSYVSPVRVCNNCQATITSTPSSQ